MIWTRSVSDSSRAGETGQKSKGHLGCRCQFCERKVVVPADLAGRRTLCPSCGNVVRVPIPRLNADGTPVKVAGKPKTSPERPAAAIPETHEGTGAWPTIDRRKLDRFEVRDARARVNAPPELAQVDLLVEEIGGGGFRVGIDEENTDAATIAALRERLRCGKRVTLKLDLPAFSDELLLDAEVVRTEVGRRGFVAALRYLTIPQNTRRRLEALVKSRVLRDLPRHRGF